MRFSRRRDDHAHTGHDARGYQSSEKITHQNLQTPTQIFPSDANLLVAGLHVFMDNTKRIPLVWNAKINTELLRNTAKNPGTNVPEFDVSCRNEMGENEKGETLLIPRDILLVWIDR